uniref:Uncharacterized protein n=1 Tax=Anguilla anguilla TaxID=7936 RepID=A0A0E9QUQ8_ANGAN
MVSFTVNVKPELVPVMLCGVITWHYITLYYITLQHIMLDTHVHGELRALWFKHNRGNLW